jgi:arylsulfatase A-like enzyme
VKFYNNIIMRRKISTRTLGCSVFALLASSSSWSQNISGRPNILVIITDQQSSESISYNIGGKYLKTPNMDYLAENGVSFTNAYCANPLSIPSRSSMFTGRYPHEVGIHSNDNKKIDPVEFPSLGTIFYQAGYETGYTGKWHLPYEAKKPESHGFLYMESIKNNGIDSLIPDAAIKFLKTKRDKPFLLVASFVNPHNICQWARNEDLPDGDIGAPPSAENCPPLRFNSAPSEYETDIMQLLRTSFQASPTFPVSGFSDQKWRQYIWAYYRMIEKVDEEIGRILTVLRQSGQDKNTIVVFLADHGDCQGAHRWNQKTVFFEEASKVPFIISYPGLESAKYDYLVQTGIDLMPTLCDLAQIPLPKKYPGTSLKPIITSGILPVEREYIVVSDMLIQGDTVNGIKPEPEGRMLRDARFKYWILNEGRQRETLYDLQNDPGEMVNLASDPGYRIYLENCRKELSEWAKNYSDPYLKYLIY